MKRNTYWSWMLNHILSSSRGNADSLLTFVVPRALVIFWIYHGNHEGGQVSRNFCKKKVFFNWCVWGPKIDLKPLTGIVMGLGELMNHKNLKFGKLSSEISRPPFWLLARKWGKNSTFSTVFEKNLETTQMGPICPQGPPEVDHHKVKSPREGKIGTFMHSGWRGHIPISFSKLRRNWKNSVLAKKSQK